MTPVIRISDAVFARLQAHSRPLVDTPSSVMERLLDQIEGKVATSPVLERPRTVALRKEGLFLTPASRENLATSILNPVPLSKIRGVASANDLAMLEAVNELYGGLYCWAMTESRRGVWNAMRPQDRDERVAFVEKGTGRISFTGIVAARIESEAIGKALWSVVPGLPWKLLYFLGEVRQRSISKERLLQELGYAEDYRVPGVIQVGDDHLGAALSRHGTIEKLFEFCEAPANEGW